MFYDFVFLYQWQDLWIFVFSLRFSMLWVVIRADKILPSESRFNTELIILLAALGSNKIELLYLVQANDQSHNCSS